MEHLRGDVTGRTHIAVFKSLESESILANAIFWTHERAAARRRTATRLHSYILQATTERIVMLPLTLLASQKVHDLLTSNSALAEKLADLSRSNGASVPAIEPARVYLSSAANDVGDTESRLGYPRVCVYSSGFTNSQYEKFRSLSGSVSTTTDVWTSGNQVEDTDRWIHFYVESIAALLRENPGDWGDGVFFSGIYDVQFQAPRAGGLGFIQLARFRFELTVSQE
jgi:hypothetical protein